MKNVSVVPMRIAKNGYIVLSALFIAFGIIFAAWSELPDSVIRFAGGTALVIFGAVKLVGYFSKDLYRLAFQYDLQFGILLIVLGAIVIVKSTNIMTFMCIALGIVILLDALFRIRVAFDAKHFGIGLWWGIFGLAIITGAAGLLLAFRPLEISEAIRVYFSIALIASGVLNLFVVLTTVKIIRNQKSDTVDQEALFDELSEEIKE